MSVAAPAASPASRLHADLVLIGITALWGGTFVVVKDALGHADPFTFIAVRFALGGVAGAVLARRHLWPITAERRPLYGAGALLGAFLFLGFAFQTVGLQHTTESRSAFITGLAVVLVPLVSYGVFRRRPSLPSMVGVAIAFVGLHVLTGGLSEPSRGSNVVTGDLLTLGCAVMFSFHIALTERFAPGKDALALVTVQLCVVALLAAVCLPFVQTRVSWTLPLLAAAVFTGLFASTLAIGLQTWAQARTTAVRAALVFSLEPVFAASFSVVLGREQLGRRELAGGLLTILAVLVAEIGNAIWAKRRARA